MRDIGIAIRNLQETGALTIPSGKEDTKDIKITSLGMIFVNVPCDIKITRLFVFGLAFGCMAQTVTIGCIHAQPRSIFKSSYSIDPQEILTTKLFYDQG